MSAWGDSQLPGGASQLQDRVVELARHADVPAPQVIIARQSGVCAAVRYGDGAALLADPVLLEARPQIRDRVLAHEFGHIMLHHTHPNRSLGRLAVVGGACGIAVTLLLLMLFVVTDRTGFVVAGSGVFVATFLLLAVGHAPARRAEFAADQVAAAQFGMPFDRALSDWLTAQGVSDPGLGWDLAGTHPSHRRRIWAARRHAPQAGEVVL